MFAAGLRIVAIVVLIFSMFIAIAGPAIAIFSLYRANYLETMHTKGIAATAAIDAARVELGRDRFYFDLSWTSQNGNRHGVRNIEVSDAYARKFVSDWVQTGFVFNLIERKIPIKYLASDPTEFILPEEPSHGTARIQELYQSAIWGSFAGAAGLAIILLAYLPRYFHVRRMAETIYPHDELNT
jgi:hypothetical protein